MWFYKNVYTSSGVPNFNPWIHAPAVLAKAGSPNGRPARSRPATLASSSPSPYPSNGVMTFTGHCVLAEFTLDLVGRRAGAKTIKIRAAFTVFKDGSIGLIGTN